jgi:hypothetical protein
MTRRSHTGLPYLCLFLLSSGILALQLRRVRLNTAQRSLCSDRTGVAQGPGDPAEDTDPCPASVRSVLNNLHALATAVGCQSFAAFSGILLPVCVAWHCAGGRS